MNYKELSQQKLFTGAQRAKKSTQNGVAKFRGLAINLLILLILLGGCRAREQEPEATVSLSYPLLGDMPVLPQIPPEKNRDEQREKLKTDIKEAQEFLAPSRK